MKFKNIFKSAVVALSATAAMGLVSCSDECPNYWDDFYGEYDPSKAGKSAYIWIDAAANFPSVANNKDSIASYVQKAYDNGFTDIIVDVRPTNGDVLFKTELVDQVTELYTWQRMGNTSRFRSTKRTATWDYLEEWINAGHKTGVRVHAAMNTMVGGNYINNGMISARGFGMVFRDPSKRDMINTINTPDGLVNQMDLDDHGERFFNPHHPEVKNLILGLVKDLATNYPDLDGIVLDRGRFKDCTTDFSDLTRGLFEEYIGQKLENWPGDVMPLGAQEVPTSNFPKYYKEWWEFRARTMHDLVEEAAKIAHDNHPGLQFTCYVGAWYGSYYQNGVNWASPNYDPVSASAGASAWCTSRYHETGYADHIDLLILGCYTAPDKIEGTNDWTAAGFAKNGATRVMGATKVIGGPDNGNWPTETHDYLDLDKYPDWTKLDFMKALYDVVAACSEPLDGYFHFDICHLQNSPQYWIPMGQALRGEPFNFVEPAEEEKPAE
ncbi:MAG: family 10 glycosylhydrolase [Bacteroidales bacterium]|nr:family 10 glycosylhydrolase [Bacteroidales bacterium]